MATVGVDLGGTKIAAALVDDDGSVSLRRSTSTPSTEGASRVVDECAALVTAVLADARAAGRNVERIGIGAAGVIDSATATVISATDTVVGWRGTELGRELAERVALPVHVLNDVHAHAVGESWIGAGRGARSILLITVGTGIGGALVVGGEVLVGAHGFGGHLGHVAAPEAEDLPCTCGGSGHLEAIASGPALLEEYVRHGGAAIASGREVFERAERGDDRLAVEVSHRAATAVGRALGGFVNTFDPDTVILGGGVARPGTTWWDRVVDAAAAETLLPLERYPIVPPQLGDDSAIVGGARFALSREKP